jgi:capsular exopolysaccharide synthesis family protein
MDIRHQLALARSWARWIAAATLIAGVIAFVVSNNVLPKVYEADARLVVGQALTSSNPAVDQFTTAQQLAAAYVSLAGNRPVLEAAMDRLGLDMPLTEFGKLISVSATRELPFIEILGRDNDPTRAADIANAMAAEIVAIAPTLSGPGSNRIEFLDANLRTIQAQIQATSAEIDDLAALPQRTPTQEARVDTLVSRLATLGATYSAFLGFTNPTDANQLTIVQPAVAPLAPASPRPLFNVAIAAALAFLLALGAAIVWEHIDDRLKSVEDVERVTGLATVGLIGQMPGERGRNLFYRLATLLYPRSPAAEAFRALRTNLDFAGLDKGLRTIVVTSSIPSEGKTVVAANLAIAYAQSGRRTILVDADLRRPGVHGIFQMPNELGLTDLVRTDETKLDDVARATEAPNLRVITAGTIPANPAELLGSRRMATIFERLTAAADVLIIDTPPVTAVTDAAVVAARADATIMVIQSHRASERIVRRGVEALAKVNARIVGAVLNNVPGPISAPYYGRRDGSASGGSGPTFVDTDELERTPGAKA